MRIVSVLLSVDLLEGGAFGSGREFSINEDPYGKVDLSLEGLGHEFVGEGGRRHCQLEFGVRATHYVRHQGCR